MLYSESQDKALWSIFFLKWDYNGLYCQALAWYILIDNTLGDVTIPVSFIVVA